MAGKTISNLNVALGATVAPFVTAFSGLGSTISGFVSAIGNAGAAVSKFTGLSSAISGVFGSIRSAGSSLLGTFASFTGAGLAVNALTGAFRKLVAAPGDAIAAAQRQSDAETKLRAVLQATGGAAGRTAEQMFAYASALQGSTTFGDEAIIEFQGTLATFKNISGDAFDTATKAALDMATVMGGDLQSTAVQLGKALNDPTEGISALTRVGVTFSEAQKQQIKTMQEAGNVAGAQTIILAELQSEFGGAAEAVAKTPFGKLKQISNAFGDAIEGVGNVLANVGATLAGAFNFMGVIGSIQSFIGTAGAWFNAAVAAWVPLFISFGTSVWSAIVSTFDAIVGYLTPIVSSIGQFIAANWQATLTSVTGYVVSIWTLISTVFDAVWTIVTTVASGIVASWNWAMDTLGVSTADTGSTVGNIFQGIADVGNWMRDVLTVAFVSLAYVIGNWRDVVGLAISAVELGVVQAGAEIVYQFGTVVPGVISWMAANWRDILTDVVNFTSTVLVNVGTNITNFMGAVSSLLTGGGFSFEWTGLTEGFESSLKTMPQIAARQIGPIEQGLQDQFDAMQQTVGAGLDKALAGNKSTTKNITDGITNTVKNGLDGIPKITIPAPTIPPVPPIAVPKVDTSGADDALDKTKEKATATHEAIANIGVGSAEQMKRIATAGLPTLDVASSASPTPASVATVAAPVARAAAEAANDKPTRDAAKDAPVNGQTTNQLLTRILTVLSQKGFLELVEVA